MDSSEALRQFCPMVGITDITIENGSWPLAAQLAAPVEPRATLVLNGATGVPMGYYRAFAQWAAEEQNIATLIYDYSGFGASLRGPINKVTRTMADWGLTDQQIARDWLKSRYPNLPLWVLGHSLGGLILPFQERLDQVDRFLLVGVGHVNTADHPWPYQGAARLFWHGHGPLLAKMLGYLPGKASGLGADLPASVYWQWRHWCNHLPFNTDDPAMPKPNVAALPQDMQLCSLTDDNICVRISSERMLRFYQSPEVLRRIAPEDHGLKSVGHIAPFHRRNAAIWPLLLGLD